MKTVTPIVCVQMLKTLLPMESKRKYGGKNVYEEHIMMIMK